EVAEQILLFHKSFFTNAPGKSTGGEETIFVSASKAGGTVSTAAKGNKIAVIKVIVNSTQIGSQRGSARAGGRDVGEFVRVKIVIFEGIGNKTGRFTA